jgi:CRISPR-associated protein Cmr1
VKNGKDIHFIKILNFSLSLVFPKKFESTILKVVKLWTLFGGVGARTRRGTGSLYCEELLEDFKDEQDIWNFVKDLGSKKDKNANIKDGELAYPRLKASIFYAASVQGNEPAAAWHSFLKSYGEYRQDRRPGDGKKRGRSYWPEPDAIRRLTGDTAEDKHKPEHHDEVWFPRAAMGLPIIFKFITPKDPGNNKEISLEPDIGTGSRLPSPVILKVIKLPNGRIIKCAFVLNQLFPEKLQLSLGKGIKPVQGDMLPFHKDYRKNKVMKDTKDIRKQLNGRTIYQSLADHLGLKEVK